VRPSVGGRDRQIPLVSSAASPPADDLALTSGGDGGRSGFCVVVGRLLLLLFRSSRGGPTAPDVSRVSSSSSGSTKSENGASTKTTGPRLVDRRGRRPSGAPGRPPVALATSARRAALVWGATANAFGTAGGALTSAPRVVCAGSFGGGGGRARGDALRPVRRVSRRRAATATPRATTNTAQHTKRRSACAESSSLDAGFLLFFFFDANGRWIGVGRPVGETDGTSTEDDAVGCKVGITVVDASSSKTTVVAAAIASSEAAESTPAKVAKGTRQTRAASTIAASSAPDLHDMAAPLAVVR